MLVAFTGCVCDHASCYEKITIIQVPLILGLVLWFNPQSVVWRTVFVLHGGNFVMAFTVECGQENATGAV